MKTDDNKRMRKLINKKKEKENYLNTYSQRFECDFHLDESASDQLLQTFHSAFLATFNESLWSVVRKYGL